MGLEQGRFPRRDTPAPDPGSHHYPESKGGAVIALFFLPAGRISYDITAPDSV